MARVTKEFEWQTQGLVKAQNIVKTEGAEALDRYTEIIKQFEKEVLRQREDEQRILNEIAAVVSFDFAQQAH